jgi:hypothetical protein
MAMFNVAALQALPEIESTMFHEEFGLRPCTVSCKESCAYTCGSLSCTHTAGLTVEEDSMHSAVIAAQTAQTAQSGQTGQTPQPAPAQR